MKQPCRGSDIVETPAILGVDGGELMPMGWGADLPGDQRADDGLSKVFETEPLANDISLLGHARLELSLTSSQPVAFLMARLCDVHPDGASTRVCYGAHNLTHGPDHSTVTILEPGKPTRICLELDATGYRFFQGHRLRLALSTTYWPLLWPSLRPVSLEIDFQDARLILPTLPPNSKSAEEFDLPAGATPRPRSCLAPAKFERTVLSDQAQGKTVMRVCDTSAREYDQVRDITTWGQTERSYVVSEDHTEATMHITRDTNLIEGSVHLRTRTIVEFCSDEENFHSTVTLEAWENDSVVSERSWKDTSPRNGT